MASVSFEFDVMHPKNHFIEIVVSSDDGGYVEISKDGEHFSMTPEMFADLIFKIKEASSTVEKLGAKNAKG